MVRIEAEIPHDICVRCAGRIFALVDSGLTNTGRGEMLQFAIRSLTGNRDFSFVPERSCRVCRGTFLQMEKYLSMFLDATSGYEFSTFLVGSTFPEETVSEEQAIQALFPGLGESIKREFNRELGKLISSKTGKQHDRKEPDIIANYDLRYDTLSLTVRGFYVKGRYRKLSREIPQTRWIHRVGDDRSVEYFIGKPLCDMLGGKEYHLHAAGREDVDVRMLGSGRDFVIEVVNPRIRHLDLEEFRERVNASGYVEVDALSLAGPDDVVKVKSLQHEKTYEAVVRGEGSIDCSRLREALSSISGKLIYQRTPLRVSGRRADKIRPKRIVAASLLWCEGDRAAIRVRAEAGTYIKEMVSGDGGRTKPSLSSLYGSPLVVSELDVVEIHREGG
ncbi:tRNA pseudouridine(54/55) synthase Pus10 [Thermogymnomonas acidicola]|uniref:tRNA pseudouridine(55) synthase n=1 Tax=Thermogymnomonas acidicola TaxID=399579 RepID=A0AA37BQH8_9ARCH|nr:tRNA pseudouridine(54/55) synthase Pus10 [Thermogymnomonas acidicola]GGM69711.1 tRNA pseudouridine(54/55) synthase Pus10 [Thermogymnomonas acidicola]